jgi:type IV pilus assembly protein PilQ
MTKMRSWVVAAALVAATTLAGVGAAPQTSTPVLTSAQALRAFNASPIDVDYQSANLRTVLRQLAEIGGVNLIIDPSVPADASVDLKLVQVPWFQVMDMVLRSGQLTHELDGTVVRVLTQGARKMELSARNETQEASKKVLLSNLPTARIRLSYAASAEVAKLLADMKFTDGGRAAVQSEPRTNMLIIQASASDIAQIREIVSDIDRPEPQVEIEARVVRTINTTLREIGVNWGFGGIADAALGNTSTLAFPNNGSVNSATSLLGTLQNEDAAGSALGLAMGAINGAFNLDVALKALESEGQLKVISTPRITTQNNQQAEVTSGVEIPYQVVTTTGGVTSTSIQFKDAALKLLVTPKITPANTVIMRIELDNGTPSTVLGTEQAGPSIQTDRARTLVQVADGTTTVIGGILATTDNSRVARTPGLSKLPLLGWLFKNTASENRSQELVIFITPRIIRG